MVGKSLGQSLGYRNDAAKYVPDNSGTIVAMAKGILHSVGWKCVVKTNGAVLTGSDDLFTITGGLVRCTIVGYVDVVLGGATNLRLTHTTVTPAATVNLNAGAVACDNDAVGTIYTNIGATSVFTPSTGLGYSLNDPVTVEEVQFLLAPGTVKCLSSAARTGNIVWYMSYLPLSPLSRVVAAA